jgi:NhaA family Na+:H+ antiporter
VSLLCGVGFTMSLFIGGLAWEHAHFDASVRLGVITGSIVSAVIGFLVLSAASVKKPASASVVEVDPAEIEGERTDMQKSND